MATYSGFRSICFLFLLVTTIGRSSTQDRDTDTNSFTDLSKLKSSLGSKFEFVMDDAGQIIGLAANQPKNLPKRPFLDKIYFDKDLYIPVWKKTDVVDKAVSPSAVTDNASNQPQRTTPGPLQLKDHSYKDSFNSKGVIPSHLSKKSDVTDKAVSPSTVTDDTSNRPQRTPPGYLQRKNHSIPPWDYGYYLQDHSPYDFKGIAHSTVTDDASICCSTREVFYFNQTLVDYYGRTQVIAQINEVGVYQLIRHGICGTTGACTGQCDQIYVTIPLVVHPTAAGQQVSFSLFKVPGYCTCRVSSGLNRLFQG